MRKGAHGNVAFAVKEETKVVILIFLWGKGNFLKKVSLSPHPYPFKNFAPLSFQKLLMSNTKIDE